MSRIASALLAMIIMTGAALAEPPATGIYASWIPLRSEDMSACSNPAVVIEPMRMRVDTMTCEWQKAEVQGGYMVFTDDCYDSGTLLPNTTVGALLFEGGLSLNFAFGEGHLGDFKICPGSRSMSQAASVAELVGSQTRVSSTSEPFLGPMDSAQNLGLPTGTESPLEQAVNGAGPTIVQVLTVRNIRQLGVCPLEISPGADLYLSSTEGTPEQHRLAHDMAIKLSGSCDQASAFVSQSGVIDLMSQMGNMPIGPNGQSMDGIMNDVDSSIQRYLQENGQF